MLFMIFRPYLLRIYTQEAMTTTNLPVGNSIKRSYENKMKTKNEERCTSGIIMKSLNFPVRVSGVRLIN